MALRDHFPADFSNAVTWEAVHGQWPAMLVMNLARRLPGRYLVSPRIHWGPSIEIDVAAYEKSAEPLAWHTSETNGGGTATAVWAPPNATLQVEMDLEPDYEYEIQVVDMQRNRRLVAAVEIVSPANKDRPEHRRAFVGKCASLIHQGVCVCIVDIVTARPTNLYADLLDFLGVADPALASASAVYAAACRANRHERKWKFESWYHPLAVGQSLPTLPLWLAADHAVPLELDTTYEETCKILRIA